MDTMSQYFRNALRDIEKESESTKEKVFHSCPTDAMAAGSYHSQETQGNEKTENYEEKHNSLKDFKKF